MATANFFDKAVLNAAQVLQGFDRSMFDDILSKHTIGIAFDNEAIINSESALTLEMLVRLLTRLYPRLRFLTTKGQNTTFKTNLKRLAKRINPDIKFTDKHVPTVIVTVGRTTFPSTESTIFFVGSNNWLVNFSKIGPVGSGNSGNPIAAGAAACFAAANVFRFIFQDRLVRGKCDEEFTLSLYDYSLTSFAQGPDIKNHRISDTTVVGVGAIGNGLLWTLLKCDGLNGTIDIVDKQDIALSNLQRYALCTQNDVKKSKVMRIKALSKGSKLLINPHQKNWLEYISDSNNKLLRVATCVDTAEDRIKIQAFLPKKIFNAWTQPLGLGVSRHPSFTIGPCLTCMYIPEFVKKSFSETVADSLKLSHVEPLIRSYLSQGKSIDEQLLMLVCGANGVSRELLVEYLDHPVETLYSEVICGGKMFRINGNPESKEVEVPAAFESTLAGILLAGELLLDDLNARDPNFPTITRINLMRPLTRHMLEPQQKHPSRECICQDFDFIEAYTDLWD